jgi:Bacterial archaeo-eukaryotic release factor family 3
MDTVDIEKLAQVRGFPAVSVLCPLERRRPGNLEDPRRLAALRERAAGALLAAADRETAERVVERLDEAIASIDLDHPADGVAVLVTAEDSHVVLLPVPVRARVVVDEAFATRELLDAAQQMLRARVIVLSGERARCFQAVGSALTEVVSETFPMTISPPVEADTPHGDFPIGEHEHAEAQRFVLRAVDRAVSELQRREHEPLVVVAPERDLAYFDEVTAHRDDVIGRVHGNHILDPVSAIEHVVEAEMHATGARRAEAAVRRAIAAVGPRGASGLEAVGLAAEAGRGHELFVERDLTASPTTPDGLDDPIDRAVDAVLTHGGRVTIVPPASLAAYDGIVLALRY